MKNKRLRATCVETSDSPIRYRRHLVNPSHDKRRVWDVSGKAICPSCRTRWRHNRDNTAEIVTS